MIGGIVSILFWLILVPSCIGLLFTAGVADKKNRAIKSCLFGLLAFFSIFHVLTVSNMLRVNNFNKVCSLFIVSTLALALIGVGVWMAGKFKKKNMPVEVYLKNDRKKETVVLWIIFGAIMVFQMVQAVRLVFSDGDDAYYVGVATYGETIPEMYIKIPYTGEYTELDTRHCLAPFPYMISFLARYSGIPASVVAHSILPVVFLLFAYAIFFLIAKEICREKREVSLIMLLSSVILMFGNYSVYSTETFLMTRVRQGKASLGSFVFPLGFYLLFLLAKSEQKKMREKVLLYVLIMLNGFVAALFSTMGNLIYPCMVIIGGFCISFGKGGIKKMLPILFTCVPSGAMAVLYLMIR